MIELRWTETAVADLERIADFLFEHVPEHAARYLARGLDAPANLMEFPSLGRPGKVDGTREMVSASLPYLGVHTHTGSVMYVVRVLHGAQKWP